MKKILITIAFLFSFNLIFSQPWLVNLPQNKNKSDITLNDYRAAFDKYWEPYTVSKGWYIDKAGKKQKAFGWKQFLRWENFWNSRVNPVTSAFPNTSVAEQYQKYLKKYPNLKSSSGNWSSMGTSSSEGGYAGIGRIATIAFHPTNNNTFWLGAPAGGLWGTTNGGSAWNVLTDQNDVLGVSAIIIPSNYETSHTIYIGTGDRDAKDNYSVGVLKSTDNGATWANTGLVFLPSNKEVVNNMLVVPGNDAKIYAATSDGLYVTENAATAWAKLSTIEFIDIEFKPGDPTIIYGATRNGLIYKSINSGAIWNQVYTSGTGSRIELAVSANDPARVYALVAAADNSSKGIYRSNDSGGSFTSIFNSYNLLGWDDAGGDSGGQAWYDLAMASDPTNANVVYVGGVNTWRSVDGGIHWAIVNHWSGNGAVAVHADKHYFAFNGNTSNFFECNDGGIYKSTDGESWSDLSNGLTISQMYALSTAQTVSDVIITGLQDNGTKVSYSGVWTDVIGGDGMRCLIDFTDENTQYGSLYYGDIYRTTDNWNVTYTEISNNIPGGANGAWVTPYVLDPNDNNTIYVGYADLWKSTNKGNSFTKIGSFGSTLASIAVAPSNSQYIYVATGSNIQKTQNGGSAWSSITAGLPVSENSITYIAVKNDDPLTVWVTLSGYNNHGVYETTNGGSTWTNISAGLPEIPVNCIIQNKIETASVQLYAGTDFGVFLKNGTDEWLPFNTGMPKVVIDELAIYYDMQIPENSRLRAATYGRGLWESDMDLSGAYAPTLITTASSNITLNSAELSGEILNDFGSTITESGFVYSTSNNPELSDPGAFYVSTSPVITSGTFTLSVTGLSEGTTYYYRAYAKNSIGTGYAPEKSFTTTCTANSVFPWTNGFENNGLIPNCWSQEYTAGDNVDWVFRTGSSSGVPATAHTGIYNAALKDSDTPDDKTMLILPVMDFSGISSANISFWHMQANLFSYQDKLRVIYKNSAISEWSELAAFNSAITAWTMESLSLPNLSSDYYIAFEGNVKNGRGVVIDDITISDVTDVIDLKMQNFSIFPNPSDGNFTLSNLSFGNATFHIYDVQGNEIHLELINNLETKSVNIHSLPGIYILKIENENRIFYKKLIVK